MLEIESDSSRNMMATKMLRSALDITSGITMPYDVASHAQIKAAQLLINNAINMLQEGRL